MNTADLINLKKNIENIDQSHHIEIFRIFQENNISYSENRNGIFINMNNIPEDVLIKINKFLTYIKTQEQHLDNVEKLKSDYKDNYFNKHNKETTTMLYK
tara:strand:+ start:5140 stop:5439 length:300 start_codon:yes stop_codon:yes gene_type:complete